jgi:ferredoxin
MSNAGAYQKVNDRIRETVLAAGYDAAAFSSVRPFGQWRASAPAGLTLHSDARDIMPEAKGIVLMFMRAIELTGWWADAARIVPFYLASNRGAKLEEQAAEAVRSLGYRVEEIHNIPMKPAAVRSGAGLRGVNGLFCHESFGPMLSIHALLTDAPVVAGDEEERLCGGCGLCQSVCPTGALMGDSRLNRPLCLREHMMRDRIAPAR